MEIKKIKTAFEDERGSIADLLTDVNINHIGLIVSKRGAFRGRHFHKEQTQWTLVLKGRLKVIEKNLLDEQAELKTFELGEMEIISTPPFNYHSHEALEDTEYLVFTTKSRSTRTYEEDTVRVQDIESFKLKS